MNRRRPRNIPSRPLVLIVDDHDDTRELYVTSLAALGFEAIAEADCAQASRRACPLLERKRRPRTLMRRIESRLVYMDHITGRRSSLLAAVCAHDLEGIVAKWKRGGYHRDGLTTS
jgi:CheY-like chemotaxis protein